VVVTDAIMHGRPIKLFNRPDAADFTYIDDVVRPSSGSSRDRLRQIPPGLGMLRPGHEPGAVARLHIGNSQPVEVTRSCG
jgi:hypothetical protein